MNKKEMTKIAKECGCKVSELPELKCPSEFDYTYDIEECPGEYIGDICEECWKNAEKPDPDDTMYRLTRKAFASDKEYTEYLKRCADVEPVQPVTEQVYHPSHYKQEGRRECIEEMRIVFGEAAVKQWCVMTAYKYRYRTGNKEGNSAEQDNKKAEWYLDYAEEMNTVKGL